MIGTAFVAALAWLSELGLCFGRAHAWLTRPADIALLAAASLWLPACVLLAGRLSLRSERWPRPLARALTLVAALSAGALGAWAGLLLTEGRLLREHPARPALVAVLGLGLSSLAPLAVWVLRWASRAPEARAGQLATGGLVGLAFGLGALDVWLLPRLYPAFHALLWGLAVFALLLSGAVAARLSQSARPLGPMLLLLSASVAGIVGLSRSPDAGIIVELAAPWTGDWVALAARTWPASSSSDPKTAVAADIPMDTASVAGIDLRDKDVLLITVDALRADALGAYGGHVGTPAMDALAEEGMVFERAYTPTPHTSYALSSMLTGKPLREVLALSEEATDQRSLPDGLRRFGYRTAAFYPPAIFFVDGARFAPLSARNFGFEYLKRMFASAEDRVGQLERYLGEVDPERPVFVWVHLFEPHEPYAPPEGEPESDAPRHRYEAEVRYVDRAVGELVRVFRARRPGALVVLSADHGEEFGDHGGLYHGTTLFDEQVRIPLVWSAPGVIEAGRSDVPVELYDIGTTLLSAVGVGRDARMRGDDLGGVLAGGQGGPRYAYASVDDHAMAVDRRYKAICRRHADACSLYDLSGDPQERHDVASTQPERLAKLRGALAAHLGSIAKVEALPLDDALGFPEALARARLGAPGAEPELLPLLKADEAVVRAEAARVLGEARYTPALEALQRSLRDDPDARVRTEAGLASCALGDAAGCDVAASAVSSSNTSLARRAAGVLAAAGRDEGVAVLVEWLRDVHAEEGERIAALAHLEALRAQAARPTLIALLDDVRLRPLAARALGQLGKGSGDGADALAQTLAEERYPPARAAEVRALLALDDARAMPLLLRMLGTDSGVMDAFALLRESGALGTRRGSLGAALQKASPALAGHFRCDEHGCAPAANAQLVLGKARRHARLLLSTHAPADTVLRVQGRALPVPTGDGQPSACFDRLPGRVHLEAEGTLWLRAFAVVPCTDDVPPPPPEPWEREGDAEGDSVGVELDAGQLGAEPGDDLDRRGEQ